MMILPTVMILLMMSQLIISQSVFSSTEEMGKILKLEKELVVEMKKHSVELEMALNSIEEYVSQVTEVRKQILMYFYPVSSMQKIFTSVFRFTVHLVLKVSVLRR